MPSRACLESELLLLNLAYGQPRSLPELEALRRLWSVDLAELSDAQLRSALGLLRRRHKWFPTAAHVLEAHRELDCVRPRPQGPSLPPDPREDARRIAVSKARLADIIESLKTGMKPSWVGERRQGA